MNTDNNAELLRRAPLELIAGRIRAARKDADLSLDSLASLAHTSRQHLINLEHARHRPRLDMLGAIATATGVDLDYFLAEVEDATAPFRDERAA